MKNPLFFLSALLLSASPAFAVAYEYKCFSFYWNGYAHERGTMELVVDSKKGSAKVYNSEGVFIEEVGGISKQNIDHAAKSLTQNSVAHL